MFIQSFDLNFYSYKIKDNCVVYSNSLFLTWYFQYNLFESRSDNNLTAININFLIKQNTVGQNKFWIVNMDSYWASI